MTGLLFVGTYRTGKDRNMYPEIQIYRNTGGNTYTRQGSGQEIRLAKGDFSPDGVLQYNLTTPISFQSGDVLGVYQPDQSVSVVRVYYRQLQGTTVNIYRNSDSPMSSINFNDLSCVKDQENTHISYFRLLRILATIVLFVLFLVSQTHPALVISSTVLL